MKLRLLSLCLGGAIGWGAALQPRQPNSDMRRAIAFERQKDVADARQARREARHPTGNGGERNRDVQEEPAAPSRRVIDSGPPDWQKYHPEPDR
jgi:hypothetical protein